MRVTNMTSTKGNTIPNQFIINGGYDGNMYFQSYKSMIAKVDKFGKIFLDEYYYNYSRTTSKYRNMFLNMTTKEIEKGIKDNEIELVNLNA
jgi:hypothetical protein